MALRMQQRQHSVKEIEIVLDNYTIILGKAGSLYPDYGTARARQLLYTIFKMYMPLIEAELEGFRHLHRVLLENVVSKIQDLKDEYGDRDAGQWTEQEFISPVVLLLKLANERGEISFEQEQNDWGRLGSVRQYLQSLNLKEHTGEEERYWPGMPSCILSIVPVWTSHQTVISASNDRFLATKVLHKRGRGFRTARLSSMQASCTPAVRDRVTGFMSNSNRFKQNYGTLRTVLDMGYITEDEIADLKWRSGLMRTHLPGVMASWSPPGTYKPTCLLDYCRFHMLRPPKAEELEQKGWWNINRKDRARRVTDKGVWDTDSCAEWAAFLELASNCTATVTAATQW